MKENDTLFIWSSLTQLIGGVFSILTFYFFLVLFNKNEKLVIFNKILILKFLLYYFLLAITFIYSFFKFLFR